MQINKGFFVIVFLLIFNNLDAQIFNKSRTPCEHVEYHLNIFNIRRGNAATISTSANPLYGNNLLVAQYITAVNSLFQDACISFKFCIIDTLNDYNYYNIGEQKTKEDIDLLSMHNKPYSINIYWANTSPKSTFNGICISDTGKTGFMFNFVDDQVMVKKFKNLMLNYFGFDYLNTVFKESFDPVGCGKFTQEQLEYLITNEQKCRKIRWQ